MKFMVCQPDTHNGFVSLINGILVYFTTILPSYSTFDDYNKWIEQGENNNNFARERTSSVKDERKIKKGKDHYKYANSDISKNNAHEHNNNSRKRRSSKPMKSELEVKEDVRVPFPSSSYAEYIYDDNTSSKEIRLKMQAAVTLPAAFNYANYHQYYNHSDKRSSSSSDNTNHDYVTNLCFSVANYSLFQCHLAMIGAPCGYLALVNLCSRRLLYIPPHDPTTVHARKQQIDESVHEECAIDAQKDKCLEQSSKNKFKTIDVNNNKDQEVCGNAAPSTITWVRNQPLVFVGYSDSRIEWYKISLHENNNNHGSTKNSKREHFVAFKETTIVASSLEQYLSNKPAFALHSVSTLSCTLNENNLHIDKNNSTTNTYTPRSTNNTINTYTSELMSSRMTSVDLPSTKTTNHCNSNNKCSYNKSELAISKARSDNNHHHHHHHHHVLSNHADEMDDVSVECVASFTLLPSREPLLSSDYFPATMQVVVVALCGGVFLFNTEKLSEPVCSFVVNGFRANFVYCHPFLPFIGTLSYDDKQFSCHNISNTNTNENNLLDAVDSSKRVECHDGCELCIFKYYTNSSSSESSISDTLSRPIRDTQALENDATEQKSSLLKLFSCHIDNINHNNNFYNDNNLHAREYHIDNSCLTHNLYSFSWKFSQSLELAICGFANVMKYASQRDKNLMQHKKTNNYNISMMPNNMYNIHGNCVNMKEENINELMMGDVFTSHYLHDVQVMRFDYIPAQSIDNVAGVSTHVHKTQQSEEKVFQSSGKHDKLHLADTFRLPIGVYSLLNVEYISAATECLANVAESTCNEQENSYTDIYNSKSVMQPFDKKKVKSTFYKEHPVTLFSSHNDTLQLFRNYNEQKQKTINTSFDSCQESTYSFYKKEPSLSENSKNTKQRHKRHTKLITVSSSPSSATTHGSGAVIPLKEDMLAAMFMKENKQTHNHYHHHHQHRHDNNNSPEEQYAERYHHLSHHRNNYDKLKSQSDYSLSIRQPVLMPAAQSMARRKAWTNREIELKKESKINEIAKIKQSRRVKYAQDMHVIDSKTSTAQRDSCTFTRMQETVNNVNCYDYYNNVAENVNNDNYQVYLKTKGHNLHNHKERKSANNVHSLSNQYREKSNVTREMSREATLMHTDAVLSKLCIGSGKFTELFVMSVHGQMHSSVMENLYHGHCVAWHEEGSVIVSMGNTVCAAEILPLQGIECAMKRRAEAGFGLYANKCIEALNTVRARAAARGYSLEFIYSSTCDENGDDFMMMFRYINILQDEHVIGETGDIPSMMELINRARSTESSNAHNNKLTSQETPKVNKNHKNNTSTNKTSCDTYLEINYVIKLLLKVLGWNVEHEMQNENYTELLLEEHKQENSSNLNKIVSYSQILPSPSPIPPRFTSGAASNNTNKDNPKINVNAIEEKIAKCVLLHHSHEAIAMLEQYSHLNSAYILLRTLLSSSLDNNYNNNNKNMLYLLEQNYETIKCTFMEAAANSPWLDTVVAYVSLSAYYAKCTRTLMEQEKQQLHENKTSNNEETLNELETKEHEDKNFDDDRKKTTNHNHDKVSNNTSDREYVKQKTATVTTTTAEDQLYNLYTTKRRKVLTSDQLTTWDKLAIMLCLQQLHLFHGVNKSEELLHDIHVFLLSSLFVLDHECEREVYSDRDINTSNNNRLAMPMGECHSSCTGSIIRPLQWLLLKIGVHLHAMEFVQEEIVNATGDSQLAACLFARVGVCHTVPHLNANWKGKHNYRSINTKKNNYSNEMECNGDQIHTKMLSSVSSTLVQKLIPEHNSVNSIEWKMDMEFVRQTRLPTLSTKVKDNIVGMNNNRNDIDADRMNKEKDEEDASLVQLWQSWVHAYRAFLNKEQLFVARTTFDRALQQLEQKHSHFDKHYQNDRSYEETGQLVYEAEKVQVQNVHGILHITDVDDNIYYNNVNNKNVFCASNLHNLHPPPGLIWGILAPFSPFYHLSSSLYPMLIHQRCVICNERVERGIRSPLHNVLHSSSSSHSLDNCYAHCSRCLHGGHVIHLKNWFRVHRECAVLGCPCHCNEDVNLC